MISRLFNIVSFFLQIFPVTSHRYSIIVSKHCRQSKNFFFKLVLCELHVKWAHCHHGMALPRVTDRGDGLQIWREAANILNKQSHTADSG
jgi:hypothetical protein